MKNYYLLIIALVSFNITMAQTNFYPEYDGSFDGAVYAQTFTFPAAANAWAGFSNNNAEIYPLSYSNGGQVSFKATVSVDAEVYFRFEANPYPDVNPAIETAKVALLAANPAETVYTVDIPANATNTYNSAILYVVTRDVDVVISETKLIQFDTDGTTELSVASPEYDGSFDGAVYAQTFTFPAAANAWAGFSNNNAEIYPLAFPETGTVSFKATVSVDAEVYFRFEANPHPDVNPAIETIKVALLAANPAETVYTVDIPANATNTYNSAIMYVVTRDVTVTMSEFTIIQNGTITTTTDCSGFTDEASEGSYTTGINYEFTSSDADVLVSFDFLDTDKVSFVPEIFIPESNDFIGMDSSNAPTYTATISGYSIGDEVSFKFRGAYSTGLVTSRLFTYVVGGADCTTAGLEDFSANAVKMYPNPAQGVVNFSSVSSDALTVSVFDVLGKQVLQAKTVQSQLNISSLNPGMYFVKMTQGSNSSTKKLVVK